MLIKNIGQLVTPRGKGPIGGKDMADIFLLENAYIQIKEGKFADIGTMDTAPQSPQQSAIDAEGGVVIPGFIDPHTHAVFYGTREKEFLARCQGEPYSTGGIQSSVTMVQAASFDQIYHNSRHFLEQMAKLGSTTVEVKSGYGLDVDNELKLLKVIDKLNRDLPIDLVPTFLGAHSIPADKEKDKYVAEIIQEMIPKVSESGLAEFCDIFCEPGFFDLKDSRRILTAAKKTGFKLKIHADEIEALGGAELAGEIGAVSAEHLLKISPAGIEALKESGTIPVLLPGTAFTLNSEYAPAREMIQAGLPVALGTDFNPGTCLINSMFIVICLAVMKMGMTVEEALTAATLNAACAMDRGDSRGSIEVDKLGDLIILSLDNYKQIPYFFGHDYVKYVIKVGHKL